MRKHQLKQVYVRSAPESIREPSYTVSTDGQPDNSKSTDPTMSTEPSNSYPARSSNNRFKSSSDQTKLSLKERDPGGRRSCFKVLLIFLAVFIVLITLATMGMSIYGLVLLSKTTTTLATTTSTTTATTTTTTSTATTTTVTLPSQCTAYTAINDMTRLTIASGGVGCDGSPPFYSVLNWFRFNGLGGSRIATSSTGPNQCGTLYTGWYAGTMPTEGASAVGTVCFGSTLLNCQ